MASKFGFDKAQMDSFQKSIKTLTDQNNFDKAASVTAYKAQTELVDLTPKKWTGDTRRGWMVIRKGLMSYAVVNTNKVMLFLEKGTKAHSAKPGKALYIPLKKRAMIWDADKDFVFGEDYVLAKRVKGIKAKKITEEYMPDAAKMFLDNVNKFLFGKAI